MTGDDQDADGFRDCLYEIAWSGAIGDGYTFDEEGEVVGLANVVVQVLPAGGKDRRQSRLRGAGTRSITIAGPSCAKVGRYCGGDGCMPNGGYQI